MSAASVRNMGRRARLEAAIDRVAGLVPGGNLMASTDPASLLETVADEVAGVRARIADLEVQVAELRTCLDLAMTKWARDPRIGDGPDYERCRRVLDDDYPACSNFDAWVCDMSEYGERVDPRSCRVCGAYEHQHRNEVDRG